MTEYEQRVVQYRERNMAELRQRQMREEQSHQRDMLYEAKRQSRALEHQENSVQTIARWVITGGILALFLLGHTVAWVGSLIAKVMGH